jgi:biotin operon repressor
MDTSEVTSENTIIELLSSPSKAIRGNLKADLDEALRSLIQEHFDGNRAAMCRSLGWNIWALNGWLDKGQKISFPKLLELTMKYRLSAFGDPQRHTTSILPTTNVKKRSMRPLLNSARRTTIERALRQATVSNQTPSINTVAKAMGISRSALKYWFPEQCSLLAKRRIDALEIFAQQAKLSRKAAVEQAIEDLKKSGLPITRRAVDRRLVSAGMTLARPELRQCYLNLRSGLPTR